MLRCRAGSNTLPTRERKDPFPAHQNLAGGGPEPPLLVAGKRTEKARVLRNGYGYHILSRSRETMAAESDISRVFLPEFASMRVLAFAKSDFKFSFGAGSKGATFGRFLGMITLCASRAVGLSGDGGETLVRVISSIASYGMNNPFS